MSLEHIENTSADSAVRSTIINEMQREDFLALAAALRQFNADQPQVSLVIATAQYGAERHPTLANG